MRDYTCILFCTDESEARTNLIVRTYLCRITCGRMRASFARRNDEFAPPVSDGVCAPRNADPSILLTGSARSEGHEAWNRRMPAIAFPSFRSATLPIPSRARASSARTSAILLRRSSSSTMPRPTGRPICSVAAARGIARVLSRRDAGAARRFDRLGTVTGTSSWSQTTECARRSSHPRASADVVHRHRPTAANCPRRPRRRRRRSDHSPSLLEWSVGRGVRGRAS